MDYKEKLEEAKRLYETANADQKYLLESLFPELKSKAYERIRKNCIHFLKLQKSHHASTVEIDECIDWLEKQCEQRSVETIEPKFKVGDWLQYRNAKPFFVEEITKQGYVNGDSCLPFNWENEIHLWTIQDARDGDVLVCIGKHGQEIGVIKEYVGKYGGCDKCFETYCFVDWDGIFRTGEYMGSKEIHPATKEQRDQLEKAMADAGYTFDFEKKELKKIEQKPTWSDEDVAMLDSAIAFVSHSPFTVIGKGKSNVIAWLKSLKDRYTWKPSEEQIKALNEVLNFAANHESSHWNDYIFGTLNNLIRQLKKLKG